MKANILDINGKKAKQIDLPKWFSEEIREDIVAKVLEAKKTQQPYGASPVAGKQHSARGKIKHLRHVWKSGYGRGKSRVPRKQMSRRGSQFNWVAAEVPFARGGMRAHPPKAISMLDVKKINKKELKIAFVSALSATADAQKIIEKYERLRDEKIEAAPWIVESKIVSLKAKDLISTLKKILGEKLFDVAIKKKSIRSGRGKMRGRKYKSNAGALLVVGEKEKIKTKAFEVRNAKELNVADLADGGVGRLTIYTEQAINDLQEKLK